MSWATRINTRLTTLGLAAQATAFDVTNQPTLAVVQYASDTLTYFGNEEIAHALEAMTATGLTVALLRTALATRQLVVGANRTVSDGIGGYVWR